MRSRKDGQQTIEGCAASKEIRFGVPHNFRFFRICISPNHIENFVISNNEMANSTLVERGHDDNCAIKRQKLTNGVHDTHDRAQSGRIFVPYRVSSDNQNIVQVDGNLWDLTDARASLFDRCSLHIYSTRKDYFPDHHFGWTLFAHVRPP